VKQFLLSVDYQILTRKMYTMYFSLSSHMCVGGGGDTADASSPVARAATSGSMVPASAISGATSHFGESLLPNMGKCANNLGSIVPGEGRDCKHCSLLGNAGL
jgi:hypothetical protein